MNNREGSVELDSGLRVPFGLEVAAWDENGDAVLVATLPLHEIDFVLAETCTLRAYPAALEAISRHFGCGVRSAQAPSVRLRAGSKPAAPPPDEP